MSRWLKADGGGPLQRAAGVALHLGFGAAVRGLSKALPLATKLASLSGIEPEDDLAGIAAEGDWIYSTGPQEWRARLEAEGIRVGGRILEVGAGNGQWLAACSPGATRVVGVEPHPECLARARGYLDRPEFAQVHLVRGQAERLPVASHQFDLVLCLGVLMFTRVDRALDELCRALAPGGTIAVTANGPGYPVRLAWESVKLNRPERLRYGFELARNTTQLQLGLVPHGDRVFPPGALDAAFRERGLEVVTSKPWLPHERYPRRHFGLTTNTLIVARSRTS